MSHERYLEVLQPGLLTTVQDLGRHGYQRYGFSPAGAADPASLILGNRLAGNAPGEAGLEVTLLGPSLRFSGPAVIAVTGADLGARVDGSPLPVGVSRRVEAGSELHFSGGRRGCRAYICVAGGIRVPPVLGSRSTDVLAGIGGLEGRPLRAGDRLPLAAVAPLVESGRRLSPPAPDLEDSLCLHVVAGPQADLFDAAARERFYSSTYTVTPAADRTGVRLDGPPIERSEAEIVSEGQALGAVQVPQNGRPIVLMCNRATIGGYPKIAVVSTPDVARLAQARPGDRVRFRAISVEEARQRYRKWWRRLHDWPIQGPAGEDGGRS